MTRQDLLALTPAALVALANRGLVKRAVKELDAGAIPSLDLSADGALHGRFADGSETVLPADAGFDGAGCSCGAVGTCRHRVGLVLAYQRRHPPGELVVTSPGAITDEELVAAFGNRALAAARRVHRAGYSARIRRASADDPVAEVELPACTVRFLVPGELGYVHTEATEAKREQTIVLAVWACRAADETAPEVPELRLDVGGAEVRSATGLEPALVVAERLLLEGAADAGPVLLASLDRLRADLEAAELRWPAAAVAELGEQLGYHRSRSAHYRARRFAELLTELHARHRAALSGTSPRSRVLGTGEPGETPLRRVRLTSLGCRISGVPGGRLAEIYFADARSATVLVLRRTFPVPDGETRTGHDLATQRINGTSLLALAGSNVVSESAYRSASRVLRLASARVAQTTTTPVGNSWARLPSSLVIRDYRAFAAELAALPPSLIRPRVAAEQVRVLQIAGVRHLTYHPGDQLLEAEITDAQGVSGTIRAHHSEHRPGALDALAAALSATPHYLSGSVHQVRGALVVDPIAVLTSTPQPTSAQPTPAQPTPAQPTPALTAPALTTPDQTAPAQHTPAQTIPALTAPAQTTPDQAVSAQSTPALATPNQAAQALTTTLIHPDLAPTTHPIRLPLAPALTPDPITTALTLLADAAHQGLLHTTPADAALTQTVSALTDAGYPSAAKALAAFATSLRTRTDLPVTWLAAYLRLTLTTPHP
ncbi:hypothetical protein [Amycolatopsis sp. 195334CR]|uniref:hypothetical protein n=1 Tax=Amycolatopsis sp. 195334CR TaxID=2814588 RepID=UPI001A8F9568|nr:hypothetical protein [Amycolatopsis sp. 195334CR]MBN6037064.1 hypothetical protein [Amycolatopsis sp. 195334CR]